MFTFEIVKVYNEMVIILIHIQLDLPTLQIYDNMLWQSFINYYTCIFINVKVKFWCDIVGSKKPPPPTVDDIYSVNTHLLKVNPTYKQQDKQLNKCR